MTYEKRPINHMLSTNARLGCQGDIWTSFIILSTKAWLSYLTEKALGLQASVCTFGITRFSYYTKAFFNEWCLSVATTNIVDASIA